MRIHFIAIGGAAMHNLALALHHKGYQVTGSDDEIFDPSKSRLEKFGLLPDEWGWFPEKIHTEIDAIILGMHARKDNPELLRAQELGLKIYSYPEFLYHQTANKKRLVIAGSHGKTTITSMVMHALKSCNKQFDYMVGAQIEGFDTMVGLSEESEIVIIEGDEYLSSPIDLRSKFLWYKPHAAVITGIAWDHANVFPTEEVYIEQFKTFIQSIEKGGNLAVYEGDEKLQTIANVNVDINVQSYKAGEYKVENQKCLLKTESGHQAMSVFGDHNMQNIEAARFLCLHAGITNEEFNQSIANFKGAARRLQELDSSNSCTAFHDFAHAPSKVKATTAAVKERDPERELIAVLELHTFSSLNAKFIPQYAGALEKADKAFVYFNPEVVKHKKLPELSADFVKNAFQSEVTVFTDSETLMEKIQSTPSANSNLLIMTSGNFDGQNIPELGKQFVGKSIE